MQFLVRGVSLAVTILLLVPSVAHADTSSGIGLVDPGQGKWYLRDRAGGVAEFYYGNPGDYPFMGDWNCDGIDTPGLYRQSDGYVYLRNSNTQGTADITFFFGNPGDVPIAGDFNGNGCDTVSIYRSHEQRFYIINGLGSEDTGLGRADYWFAFGNPGDTPISGDFDGDGVDEVGLHRVSTGLVYFVDQLVANAGGGAADHEFYFGDPGDRFVAGDWNGSGAESPALYRPSGRQPIFYLKYSNADGLADEMIGFGQYRWLPVAGHFGTLPQAPPDSDLVLRPVLGRLVEHFPPPPEGTPWIYSRIYLMDGSDPICEFGIAILGRPPCYLFASPSTDRVRPGGPLVARVTVRKPDGTTYDPLTQFSGSDYISLPLVPNDQGGYYTITVELTDGRLVEESFYVPAAIEVTMIPTGFTVLDKGENNWVMDLSSFSLGGVDLTHATEAAYMTPGGGYLGGMCLRDVGVVPGYGALDGWFVSPASSADFCPYTLRGDSHFWLPLEYWSDKVFRHPQVLVAAEVWGQWYYAWVSLVGGVLRPY